MIILNVKLKDGTFQSFEFLGRKYISIGRWKNNVVVLDDPTVSGHHANIDYVNDLIYLYDLNSRNGSFVNKKRITSQLLKNGDVINLGNSTLEYVNEDLESKFDELESRRSSKTEFIDTTKNIVDDT
jgi:adenylate cyclase